MYKLLFPHQFPNEPPIRVVRGDFTKLASFCPPEVASFLKDFSPAEGKTYLLVNALGAGEYWGSNVNGDHFPERALMHKGASHGYKTFELFARVYEHHMNKDPARAMGAVKLAAYNPVMHRIELLLEIDNEKGKGLIDKISASEYPDWSMGCRVPFDICSNCGHQAKKVADYCDHLKHAMNKINPDGRRNSAINTLPKFFDISHVLIGADKTAKMLKKVAGASGAYPSAVLGLAYYGEDVEKTAASKGAQIEKEIVPDSVEISPRHRAAAKALLAYEAEIPAPVIDKLSSFELPEVLSTASYMGILLGPSEFQRLVLTKVGKAHLARKLAAREIVFLEPTNDQMENVDAERDPDMTAPGHVKRGVFDVLHPFVPHRSIFERHSRARLDRIAVLPAARQKSAAQDGDLSWVKTADAGLLELLGALGLSYFLYRRGFPLEAKQFEAVMIAHPWLAPIILGSTVAGVNVVDSIVGPTPRDEARLALEQGRLKMGAALPWKTIGTILGPIGLAYLTAASAARKEMRGYPLSATERFIKDYPAPLGVLGVYGLLKARKALRV